MTAGLATWLRLWSWVVVAFGALLGAGAIPATDGLARLLFTLLGGPAAFTAETRFALGVLGGVTIGWGLTFMAVLRGLAAGEAGGGAIWRGLALAVGAWFVIDSALSIATGYGLNVVPNLILLAGFVAPVWRAGLFDDTGARVR